MSLVKPVGITGLNTGHPLNANIRQFLEFGGSNTDLVNASALTTGATNADIAALGKCVLATSANKGVTQKLIVSDADTILLIYQHVGLGASSSTTSFANLTKNIINTQNSIDLRYQFFGSQDYEIVIRGNGGVAQKVTIKPFTDQGFLYGNPHAMAFSSSPGDASALVVGCMDGTQLVVANNTAQNDPYSPQPLSVDLISDIGVDGNTYLSAAIVFNKRLSAAEMVSVTTDPWAMVATTAAVLPGIGQLTVQFEGVAINVADWHIITRLAADQSILYNQTGQSSDASGNIAAFATTSGSVGDTVRVEGLSAADAYSFVIEQNLGNIA
jgi:hypothetical protein